jgi:predicted transcriptional regulator of viral defense system
MANLMNWHNFEKKLKEKNLPLFSRLDVTRVFGVTPIAAKFLLHRYAKKKFITRVKRGLYTFAGESSVPTPYLANKLYEPSYVSLEFALSYHRVIPETVYEITSVSTKKTQRFQAMNKTFSYRRIKKEAFTGYETARQGAFTFFIADPEKAFVDLAYLKTIRQKNVLDRFDKKRINKAKALRYAKLFGSEKLMGVIKNILK